MGVHVGVIFSTTNINLCNISEGKKFLIVLHVTYCTAEPNLMTYGYFWMVYIIFFTKQQF